jgi:phospholipase/carboxylesterase
MPELKKNHRDGALEYVEIVPSGKFVQGLPLVVVLHGRGADANDLADLAPQLAAGSPYRFLFPNAPRRFEPMPGYAVGFSWFDGFPPSAESFRQSRAVLTEFIAQMYERYEVTPGKTVLAGFSQGGMMSLDVGFRLEKPVSAIVCMSGAINDRDLPPLRERPNQRVLIVHGTQDEMIPVHAARKTRRILEEHGIKPEYHEFAMGHWVTEESLQVVRDFIHRCLG